MSKIEYPYDDEPSQSRSGAREYRAQQPPTGNTEVTHYVDHFAWCKLLPVILSIALGGLGLIGVVGAYFLTKNLNCLIGLPVILIAGLITYFITEIIVSYFLLKMHYIQKHVGEEEKNKILK